MIKYSILGFWLLFSLQLIAQENLIQDRITLIAGDVFVGKIVLKTNDIIMFTTKDGLRYQFQLTDVRTIESDISTGFTIKKEKNVEELTLCSTNFGGLVELSTGVSSARFSCGLSPNTQLSLLFGNKNFLGQNLFFWVGVGYDVTYLTQKAKCFEFLPVFFRIQSALTKRRISPFVGMDAGYSFALNSANSGGSSIKISAGVVYKINPKNIVYTGFYVGVQSFSGILTEINELGIFTYNGKTAMKIFGAKIGLQF